MNKITGNDFKRMLVAGARNLANHGHIVDKLNVFPVPDGDTGKNMTMTFTAGANKIGASEETSVGKLAKALSRELLMSARGNSGVILSQLFRGFATGLEAFDVATTKEIALALESGVETAYKAVMKPVEGTILTVARESAEELSTKAEEITDIIAFYEHIIAEMKISLDGTPELLPVLKEAGVVDSGGQGLVYIYEGFLKALKGEEIELDASAGDVNIASAYETDGEGEFGYCTEFIVRLDDEKETFNETMFRQKLSDLGDSIVVVQDEDIVKVHVHTLTPGDALNMAQRYGEFVNLKIENMSEQVGENGDHSMPTTFSVEPSQSQPKKAAAQVETAIIAVANGSGVKTLFESSGVHHIIEGGQTMNPSTEDFIHAIESLNSKNVIILPNNSNIIMAANQAKDAVEDVNVVVIPSKTIPQGYAALAMFNEQLSPEDMEADMQMVIQGVKSGSVTYAVRDTNMNGIDIKKDDFIGILDKDIVVSLPEQKAATQTLIEKMMDEDAELVTLIYGEDVTEAEAEEMGVFIEINWPDAEVLVVNGNQPVYGYMIAVE